MKRGGKITRAMKAIRAEQEVLQRYKAEVTQAVETSESALKARILSIKAGRDIALEQIRKGEKADGEAEKDKKDEAAGSNEASRFPGKRGNEPKRSTKSGLEGQRQKKKKPVIPTSHLEQTQAPY